MKTTRNDPKVDTPAEGARRSGLEPLDPALLRHVSGGARVQPPGPKGTWCVPKESVCGPKGTW